MTNSRWTRDSDLHEVPQLERKEEKSNVHRCEFDPLKIRILCNTVVNSSAGGLQ